MVNGQWELQHRYVNFTRSGISISLMYVNTADAQQTIVGVINLISNPQYMMLSFEQSYEGTIQQFDGLNFYITETSTSPSLYGRATTNFCCFPAERRRKR